MGGTEKPWSLLGDTVRYLGQLSPKFQPRKIDLNEELTNPLSYTVNLTLLVLKGDDGDTGHAVCVANGWIFDSTLKRALPICKESFDFCVGEGRKMICVERGYMFAPAKHWEKRMRKHVESQTKKQKTK